MTISKNLILVGVLFSSLFLYGCQGEYSTPTAPTGVIKSETAVTPTQEAELPPATDITQMQIVESSDHPEVPPTETVSDLEPEDTEVDMKKKYSDEDNDIMAEALDKKDSTICEKISDEEMKQACIKNVEVAEPLGQDVSEFTPPEDES